MIEYVYILTIKGMRCGMCEAHIDNQIRNNFKVKKVSSNRYKNETIIISLDILDEEKIKSVIKMTGYDLVDITLTKREKKPLFHKN